MADFVMFWNVSMSPIDIMNQSCGTIAWNVSFLLDCLDGAGSIAKGVVLPWLFALPDCCCEGFREPEALCS